MAPMIRLTTTSTMIADAAAEGITAAGYNREMIVGSMMATGTAVAADVVDKKYF